MKFKGLSPNTFHKITRFALWSLVAIVITGGAVRLTGSGLGCSDWPNCEPGQLVPKADIHGWVEFGNRLITGLVSIAVIFAVSGSLLRYPRDKTLTSWSIGLVVGVIIQIILGAVTVITHLSPPIVMAHFLVSMVLIWNAVVLEAKASNTRNTEKATLPYTKTHCWLVGTTTAIAVFTGTIVTASGPHGGDENVNRLNFDLPDVARIHGVSVFLLVFFLVGLNLRLKGTQQKNLYHSTKTMLIVVAAQAAIGYVQYFNQLPPLLVACHIAGATAVWISAVRLMLKSVTAN